MARRDERVSDPGDEEGRSLAGRIGVGCGVALLVGALLAGAIGIVLGARDRLAGWSDDEPGDAPIASADPAVAPDPTAGSGGAPTGPDPVEEARRSMARRFRPGPFVQLESMVPSGRILPATSPAALPTGQTIDNPWAVVGGELRPGRLPGASASDAPSIRHAAGESPSQPLTILPRTPARVQLRAADARGGTDVAAYLVDFEGYDGHFHLPAMVMTELGAVQAGGSDGATVHFTIRAAVMSDGVPLQPGQSVPVTMRIAAVDDDGRVSAPVSRPLRVMAVGAGDVEVTLTMGEPTDLDLYVTDPAGTMIYFGNRDSFTGGHLDLDANAACSSNVGVDNEHVFWPAQRAPAGTYRVHVAHYESCIANRPVDFRVTVHACGEIVVLSGRYEGGGRAQVCRGPGPGDRAWCQEVVTFDIPPCVTMR